MYPPTERLQTLQHVQFAGHGRRGFLIHEDRHGNRGLANRLKADIDLWIGGHMPGATCCRLDTCRSIGATLWSQERPLER